MRRLLLSIVLLVSWVGVCHAQQVQIEKYYNWTNDTEDFGAVLQPKQDTGLIVAFSSMRYGYQSALTGAPFPGHGLIRLTHLGDSVQSVVDTGNGGNFRLVETSYGYVALGRQQVDDMITSTFSRLRFYNRSLQPTQSVLLDSILPGKTSFWQDLHFSADSGLYVFGYTIGSGPTSWDLVLARFNPLGPLEWVRSYPLPFAQEANYIMPDTGGCLLLSGTTRFGAAHVVGVRPDGEVRFERELYRQPRRIYASSTRRLQDGGYLTCLDASDQDTSFLFRFDSGFNLIWKKPGYLFFSNSLWAYTDGTGAIVQNLGLNQPYKFVKFSLATGDTIWTMNLARRSSNVAHFSSFTYYPNGDAAIVGIAPQVPNRYPASDMYFCRIQGLGIPYHPDSGLVTSAAPGLARRGQGLFVHPNPARTCLSVFCPEAGSLRLLDAQGRLALELPATREQTLRLDVAGLPRGLYVLRLGARTKRVVLE